MEPAALHSGYIDFYRECASKKLKGLPMMGSGNGIIERFLLWNHFKSATDMFNKHCYNGRSPTYEELLNTKFPPFIQYWNINRN